MRKEKRRTSRSVWFFLRNTAIQTRSRETRPGTLPTTPSVCCLRLTFALHSLEKKRGGVKRPRKQEMRAVWTWNTTYAARNHVAVLPYLLHPSAPFSLAHIRIRIPSGRIRRGNGPGGTFQHKVGTASPVCHGPKMWPVLRKRRGGGSDVRMRGRGVRFCRLLPHYSAVLVLCRIIPCRIAAIMRGRAMYEELWEISSFSTCR